MKYKIGDLVKVAGDRETSWKGKVVGFSLSSYCHVQNVTPDSLYFGMSFPVFPSDMEPFIKVSAV